MPWNPAWVAARSWRRLAVAHLVAIAAALVLTSVLRVLLTAFLGATTTMVRAPLGRDQAQVLYEVATSPLPPLLLTLAVATVSGLLMARYVARRLRPLEIAATRIADGDLTTRVADRSPDEIGSLGRALDLMAVRLAESLRAVRAEKDRVDALLAARRDLVVGVSHELRTPIATLSAHLETLAEHPGRLGEYLPILRDQTARTARLIDELFELSRIDAGEQKVDLAPVSLPQALETVVASLKRLAWKERRIALEVHLPGSLPAVHADARRLEQIVVNLVGNALRFTPEGGLITIEAAALGREVEVRVSDTGIGIPPHERPHVFDRFYRGDHTKTCAPDAAGAGDGAGLGLAIVKGWVEAMGGSVEASSSEGGGTTIAFRLPSAGA